MACACYLGTLGCSLDTLLGHYASPCACERCGSSLDRTMVSLCLARQSRFCHTWNTGVVRITGKPRDFFLPIKENNIAFCDFIAALGGRIGFMVFESALA